MDFDQILNFSLWNNTGRDYLIAFGIFLASYMILKLFKFIVLRRLKAFAKKTKTDIDDMIIGILDSVQWPFYVILSLFVALQFLEVHEQFLKIFNYIIIIIIVYYIIKAISVLIDYFAFKTISTKSEEKRLQDEAVIKLLSKFAKFSLWLLAILYIMSNMGFNITSLIAGMGIGGIAIALALQNILSDLFASVSIYFDKPFEIGDFIIIGTDKGIVKKIGIKSTRIQTLQGEELVVSNKELTSIRIQNFKKMKKRRAVFPFGVTYDTPVIKVRKIPNLIDGIFKKIKIVELDRVHFKEFGDFSLNFEVVYYINSKEYAKYMDTQQDINLDIMKAFEKEKIEFAFPTQTVYVTKG